MNKITLETESYLIKIQRYGEEWMLYVNDSIGGNRVVEMEQFQTLPKALYYAKTNYFPLTDIQGGE